MFLLRKNRILGAQAQTSMLSVITVLLVSALAGCMVSSSNNLDLSAAAPIGEDIRQITPDMQVPKIKEILERAEAGDPYAQYLMGVIYAEGNSITQDFEQSFKWLIQAAAAGLPEAQYHVGYAFLQGIGVIQNDLEAHAWYLLAAEAGLADAQFNLSLLYLEGRGIEQDTDLAVNWTFKAPLQDHASALLNLGVWYGGGLNGLPINDPESFKWYKKAAQQNLDVAKYVVSERYHGGVGVPSNVVRGYAWLILVEADTDLVKATRSLRKSSLTPEQINQANELASVCRLSKYTECD